MTTGSSIQAKACPSSASECFGYDFNGAATASAGFDVDIEYTFQSLGPAHCGMALTGCFLLHISVVFSSLSTSSRCNRSA